MEHSGDFLIKFQAQERIEEKMRDEGLDALVHGRKAMAVEVLGFFR